MHLYLTVFKQKCSWYFHFQTGLHLASKQTERKAAHPDSVQPDSVMMLFAMGRGL